MYIYINFTFFLAKTYKYMYKCAHDLGYGIDSIPSIHPSFGIKFSESLPVFSSNYYAIQHEFKGKTN